MPTLFIISGVYGNVEKMYPFLTLHLVLFVTNSKTEKEGMEFRMQNRSVVNSLLINRKSSTDNLSTKNKKSSANKTDYGNEL